MNLFIVETYGEFIRHTDDVVGCYQLLVKSMHKKVLKGTKWMPRRILPMKDVEDCDKLRVAVNKLLSGDFRMGKPSTSYVVLSLPE